VLTQCREVLPNDERSDATKVDSSTKARSIISPCCEKLLPGYIKIVLYFNLHGSLVRSKTGGRFGASRNNICLSTAIEISFQGWRQH